MFRAERYGEGSHNAAVGVANRLREVDSGIASKDISRMYIGERFIIVLFFVGTG